MRRKRDLNTDILDDYYVVYNIVKSRIGDILGQISECDHVAESPKFGSQEKLIYARKKLRLEGLLKENEYWLGILEGKNKPRFLK